MTTTLAEELKHSDTNEFLKIGPDCPGKPDWVYKDFRLMPQDMWLELINMLGDENIQICAANSRNLPPAKMCRAQIWISPQGQEIWDNYIKDHQ